MKRLAPLFAAALIFALVSRPFSPGTELRGAAGDYALALYEGRADDALSMMTPELAEGLCSEFLLNLQETPPDGFSWNGSDQLGMRMAGTMEGGGTRVLWLQMGEDGPKVSGDTSLDNLLGTAVLLCRENARSSPDGFCPVSGRPYFTDVATGAVVCPSGHLGDGLFLESGGCGARRDSVAAEISSYLAAGYPFPATIEQMFAESDGAFGRRGGYSCPDNGYKYYEIRDGAVYCPYHEESSLPVEIE